jgi:hypothetical protein
MGYGLSNQRDCHTKDDTTQARRLHTDEKTFYFIDLAPKTILEKTSEKFLKT